MRQANARHDVPNITTFSFGTLLTVHGEYQMGPLGLFLDTVPFDEVEYDYYNIASISEHGFRLTAGLWVIFHINASASPSTANTRGNYRILKNGVGVSGQFMKGAGEIISGSYGWFGWANNNDLITAKLSWNGSDSWRIGATASLNNGILAYRYST